MNEPRELIFFTDRDLGRQFPALLRAAGVRLERRRLAKLIAREGDPDRKRFAKASLARLAYISLIAAVLLIVFRRDGIAVLAGLAVFHLLAALATAVPALKEFRKA